MAAQIPLEMESPDVGRSRDTTYGLGPMQAGMLFQALLESTAAEKRGFDVEQIHIVLEEALDIEAFRGAWTLVARRHAALCSSFRWEGVKEPRQIVNSEVTVPLSVESWAGLDDDERARRRDAFLASDRRRGFDPKSAPLMRIRVFRRGRARTEIVWTFHHILLDGRSCAPLLLDVFRAYDALFAGRPAVLPEAPRPFREFITWFERLNREPSLRFFRELLSGKSAPTPLPCAEPAARPLPQNGYGEVLRVLDEATVSAVRALAKSTGTTVSTVVDAAWALVLSRFTGDDDVVFGSTRACRRSALGPAADSMIGLFINTLPMRGRVRDDSTVSELLIDLRRQSVALREHEHTPLVDIQLQSDMPRGAPLFETLVVFDNQALWKILRASGEPRFQRFELTLHEQPSLPLSVTVFDDDRFEIKLIYDGRRFAPSAVERLAEGMTIALEQLSRDGGRKLRDLDVLSEAAQQKIVFQWNDTARPFDDGLCIHEPFEARVAKQPNAVAVEMDGQTLTYRQLEERANRLAHALRARGAKPGVYVGICFARGLDLVVALLAVAKSGAAYVPLDPQYPRDRIAFMLSDAEALLVVTEQRHAALFDGPTLVLDGGAAAEVAAMSAARPARTAQPSDVCYAIFTSGSTGVPKGVVLSHRAVINTFDWVTRTFAVGPGDRLLFVTSPCFDLSVYDTFGALGAGATVVVASDDRMKDPTALAAAITEQRITVWDSAPAALQRLLPFFPERSDDSALRLTMLSGDWIPLSLPDAIRAAFPRAEVRSLGGATEAAIWSNWFPVGAVDPRWNSIPYGRPIQNSHYHVLDHRMRPVPVGVAADLYIGGACLANGYLNRAELTSERFVPDPFRPGERLYKTGDLSRYFEDGDLEFLGRSDFQVKIRGFRVEMGEIEAVICGLPGVREAVCAAYVDASGQKSLSAYVVARDGARLTEESIKQAVAAKLPDFMVPSHVVELAAMPLSSNGKLDRNALPSPMARTSTEAIAAPRTVLERKMVEVWEELLQRKPIGIRDDFFQLGGHSMLAVMLVSRVKSQLGLELPLSRVLERPTIETLVASLEDPAASRPRHRHMLVLSSGGHLPPLFLLPGAGGYGFMYKSLPALLGPAQPIYILQAVGAEGDEGIVNPSIEEMAAIYEPQILEAAPDGPLVLAGYSFGVLVAFELVHRLRQQGRTVNLLISLDGLAPGYPEMLPPPERILSHARAFAELEASKRGAYLMARLENLKRRVLVRFGRAEFESKIAFAEAELNERLGKLWSQLWQARLRYAPDYAESCRLLLVKSAVPERWVGTKMDDAIYGWDAFIRGPITMTTVPGPHMQLFSPGNQVLIAEAIAAHVAKG